MKLGIVITTKHAETNWNALRLANFALTKGDEVGIFLIGEGVEYEQAGTERFNIQNQLKAVLQFEKAQVMACGTCMKMREQQGSETCPVSGLEDLYALIATSDKVVTF